MGEFEIVKLTEKYIDDVFDIESELIGKCDKKSILNSINSDSLNYYILLKNQEVVGFLECLILPPEIELYDIAVASKFQGKGYSKLMMDYLLSLAENTSSNTILLEVNSINYKAIGLYEKYGFKKYSERKNYYGNNDAILMRLDID